MSSKQYLKEFRNKQQMRDDQTNYLLADVEKNLEHRNALEQKKGSCSKQEKYSSLQSKATVTLAENKNLKAYIVSLKEHI